MSFMSMVVFNISKLIRVIPIHRISHVYVKKVVKTVNGNSNFSDFGNTKVALECKTKFALVNA